MTLKPCPLCEGEAVKCFGDASFSKEHDTAWCNRCGLQAAIARWESRPIEARLRAALQDIYDETSIGVNMNPKIRDIVTKALK